MSTPLPPSKRSVVLETVYDALATANRGSFSQERWNRPGGVLEVEQHLDQLVDIVRRTTARRLEPYQLQILEDICARCPHQESCGYCSLRKIHQCVLYECASALVEGIAAALVEIEDPDYLEAHRRHGGSGTTTPPTPSSDHYLG